MLTQLRRRLEASVRTEVLHPRRADRTRYGAALGINGLLLAAVSLAGAGVEDRHAPHVAHGLEVEDALTVRLPGVKVTFGDRRSQVVERRAPRLQPAGEHRLRLVPEPAQEEPKPRRHRAAGVVVGDPARVGVHARPLHLGLELGGGWKRMATGAVDAGHSLEVDEHGAGDVGALVLLAAVAALEIPAAGDHPDVRGPDGLPHPLRADQGAEAQS